MHINTMITKASVLAFLVAAMTACGGGGDSGGGDTGGGDGTGGGGTPGGGDPGSLSGLDGDANNQDLLYFSHSYEVGEDPDTGQTLYRSVLYALDPANPEVSLAMPMDTQDSALGSDMGRTHYAPLYEADIDDTDGRVSNYRVADVLYLHNRLNGLESSEGFARVGTQVGAADPVRVTTETYLGASVTGAGTLLRQNYADSGHAAVVYGLPGNERRVRMGFSGTDDPQTAMSPTVRHITALEEGDSPGYQRYLVLRTHEDLRCTAGYRLVQNRSSSSPGPGAGNLSSIAVDNLLPGNKEARNAVPLGGPMNDGSHYLIIETLVDTGIVGRPCLSEGATLWRYKPLSADPLVQVLDGNDAPLVFPQGVAGGPILPSERHIAHQNGVLYFGVGNSLTEPQDLYRVEQDSWSVFAEAEEPLGPFTGFVIAGNGRVAASAGNTVVSWNADGGDRQELDNSDAAWLGIQTDVLGSRDGWIFYNRPDGLGRDYAVAMKTDGSDSMEIADAQWIGASMTGNGEAIGYINELSEVFLWNNDKEIAAVSAADPNAGKVVLGELGTTPENVSMYGLAPGPHRLIRVHRDSDNSEVYYVNTRAQGSLRKVLDEPTGEQRPVDGF